MSEQYVFTKDDSTASNGGIQRNAVELPEGLVFRAIQYEYHKSGANRSQSQAKLPGHGIAEIGRTKFWDRKAARSNNQRSTIELPEVRSEEEPAAFLDRSDTAVENDPRIHGSTFGLEHVDDLLR